MLYILLWTVIPTMMFGQIGHDSIRCSSGYSLEYHQLHQHIYVTSAVFRNCCSLRLSWHAAGVLLKFLVGGQQGIQKWVKLFLTNLLIRKTFLWMFKPSKQNRCHIYSSQFVLWQALELTIINIAFQYLTFCFLAGGIGGSSFMLWSSSSAYKYGNNLYL